MEHMKKKKKVGFLFGLLFPFHPKKDVGHFYTLFQALNIMKKMPKRENYPQDSKG